MALVLSPLRARSEVAFPVKPVQFMVPFTPGGGADNLARVVGQKATAEIGQQVVIENRPGAGGNIAAQVVARARPDGYTLLQGNLAHAIAMTMYRTRTYDIVKDFAPICQLGSAPFVFLMHAEVPAKSLREFIALAKSKPGVYSYASSGIGGPSHLTMELFTSMTGISLVHVPYKGAAPAAEDLMAGRVQCAFLSVPAAQALIKSGKLRGFGVSRIKPLASMPEMEPIGATDVPGFDASTWFGVMAPAKTSAAVVNKLHDVFAVAVQDPDTVARLSSEGFDLEPSTPEAFAAFIVAETQKWAPIVRASGAVIN